jgi:hypothetical protein
MRRLCFFLVCLAFFPTSNASFAETAYGGSCAPGSTAVTPERATEFLDAPATLLNSFPDGQGGLAAAVRDLVTVRPETIEGLQTLVAAATPDQSRAIGAGLGTAASVCVLREPATAQQIQEAVLRTDNNDVVEAFVSITGDIKTTAIPGSDPTGESVPGGGQGSVTPEVPGSASSSDSIVFNGSSGTATQSLFAVSAASAAAPLSPVSPAQ